MHVPGSLAFWHPRFGYEAIENGFNLQSKGPRGIVGAVQVVVNSLEESLSGLLKPRKQGVWARKSHGFAVSSSFE